MKISHAAYADLPDVAEAHVDIWRQAYVGQVPQPYLDSLDPAQRLKSWQEGFGRHGDDPRFGLLLARAEDNTLAGFLSYGPARDEDRKDWPEIYAINLRRAFWGQGTGHNLFREACAILKPQGPQTYLWVLETNLRARKAYTRWGGRMEETRTKTIDIAGTLLKEISVVFAL